MSERAQFRRIGRLDDPDPGRSSANGVAKRPQDQWAGPEDSAVEREREWEAVEFELANHLKGGVGQLPACAVEQCSRSGVACSGGLDDTRHQGREVARPGCVAVRVVPSQPCALESVVPDPGPGTPVSCGPALTPGPDPVSPGVATRGN